MEHAAFIRKATGDFIEKSTDKLMSGQFWEVKCQGTVICRKGSMSRKAFIQHVQDNFGSDVEIYERVA